MVCDCHFPGCIIPGLPGSDNGRTLYFITVEPFRIRLFGKFHCFFIRKKPQKKAPGRGFFYSFLQRLLFYCLEADPAVYFSGFQSIRKRHLPPGLRSTSFSTCSAWTSPRSFAHPAAVFKSSITL